MIEEAKVPATMPAVISVTGDGDFADVQFSCGSVRFGRSQRFIDLIAKDGARIAPVERRPNGKSMIIHVVSAAEYDNLAHASMDIMEAVERSTKRYTWLKGLMVGIMLGSAITGLINLIVFELVTK